MILLLVACVGPGAPPAGPSVWEELAPLPVPVQEVGVVAVGESVWVMGGFDDGLIPLDTVFVLGPDGTWSQGPALPRPLHHLNVAVHGGRVYVLGALEGLGFSPTADAWVHDGAAWSALPAVPEPLGASAVGVVDGEIVVAGGLPGPHTRAYAFDPGATSWRALPDLPVALDHAVGAGGAEMLVLGGRQAGLSDVRDAVVALDGAGWSSRAPLPTARAGCAGGIGPDGRVWIAGGEGNPADPDGVFAEVERYDPTTDTWDTLSPMRTPRHGTQAAWWQGGLLVPGGATVRGFFAVDTVEWLPGP